jgi:hypothetical protein
MTLRASRPDLSRPRARKAPTSPEIVEHAAKILAEHANDPSVPKFLSVYIAP